MIIGVVLAMPIECASLTQTKIKRGQTIYLAPNILINCGGIGANNADIAAKSLISQGVRGLISWGCCGGLDTTLQAGDLLLPQSVGNGQSRHNLAGAWFDHTRNLLQPLNPNTNSIYQADKIIADAAAKQQLGCQGFAAVDMESYSVCAVATQHRLPALVIRTISDSAKDTLPPAIAHSLHGNGDISLGKLLWSLLQSPSQLPATVRTAQHLQKSLAKLTLAAASLAAIADFQ